MHRFILMQMHTEIIIIFLMDTEHIDHMDGVKLVVGQTIISVVIHILMDTIAITGDIVVLDLITAILTDEVDSVLGSVYMTGTSPNIA